MSSVATALALLLAGIPKIIGFLVILVIGWLIASVLAGAVATLLRALKFNDLAQRAGLTTFVHNMGVRTDAAGFLANTAEWFVRLIEEVTTFGEQLPAVREHVAKDLAGNDLGSARVLGCAVRLLDLGSFRIGCDRYALHDDTHGLTTMLAGYVRLDGQTITFDYVGKAHKHHLQHVLDGEASAVVRRLLAERAPEQRLFAFWHAARWVDLHAADVNHYLREASGMSSSAKEFRTWNATVLAAATLAGVDPPRSARTANHAISRVAKVVSDYLGNTPAIARRSYVDPRVFDRYRAGWTIHPEFAELGIGLEARPPSARRPVEVAVLDLLQQRLDSERLRPLARAA